MKIPCLYCRPRRCVCIEAKQTNEQLRKHLEMIIPTLRGNYERNPHMFRHDKDIADNWQAVLDTLTI
jgi:hypothetical protein